MKVSKIRRNCKSVLRIAVKNNMTPSTSQILYNCQKSFMTNLNRNSDFKRCTKIGWSVYPFEFSPNNMKIFSPIRKSLNESNSKYNPENNISKANPETSNNINSFANLRRTLVNFANRSPYSSNSYDKMQSQLRLRTKLRINKDKNKVENNNEDKRRNIDQFMVFVSKCKFVDKAKINTPSNIKMERRVQSRAIIRIPCIEVL